MQLSGENVAQRCTVKNQGARTCRQAVQQADGSGTDKCVSIMFPSFRFCSGSEKPFLTRDTGNSDDCGLETQPVWFCSSTSSRSIRSAETRLIGLGMAEIKSQRYLKGDTKKTYPTLGG